MFYGNVSILPVVSVTMVLEPSGKLWESADNFFYVKSDIYTNQQTVLLKVINAFHYSLNTMLFFDRCK